MATNTEQVDGQTNEVTEHVQIQHTQVTGQRQRQRQRGNAAKGTQQSGGLPFLKKLMAGATIYARPERSYYIVDVAAVLFLFRSIEGYIRGNHVRGGWLDGTDGQIAGLCLRSLIIKLQHVSIATDQLTLNSSDMMSMMNLEVPAVAQYFIECYGVKSDTGTGVEIAPRVTVDLLNYLATLSTNLLITTSPDHITCRLPANHMGYLEACYGPQIQITVSMADLAAELGVGFSSSDCVDGYGTAVALMSMYVHHRNVSGLGPLTGANLITMLTADNNGLYLPSQFFLQGGAPPVAGGFYSAAAVAAITHARVLNNDLAPAMPAGVTPMANHRVVAPTLVATVVTKLKSVVKTREPTVHVAGSFAPLVSAEDDDHMINASSGIKMITVEEMVAGSIIHQRTHWLTSSDIIFNVATRQSRIERYFIAPLNCSIDEAIVKCCVDSRITL